jgi:hypothetical protein
MMMCSDRLEQMLRLSSIVFYRFLHEWLWRIAHRYLCCLLDELRAHHVQKQLRGLVSRIVFAMHFFLLVRPILKRMRGAVWGHMLSVPELSSRTVPFGMWRDCEWVLRAVYIYVRKQ